jgi:hypothetical protein
MAIVHVDSFPKQFSFFDSLLLHFVFGMQEEPLPKLGLKKFFGNFALSKISYSSQGIGMPNLVQIGLSVLEQ